MCFWGWPNRGLGLARSWSKTDVGQNCLAHLLAAILKPLVLRKRSKTQFVDDSLVSGTK
jgi:hypothetical protein